MKVAKYEWDDNARVQRTDDSPEAEVVGKRLEFLRQRCKGELTPQDVVDDARNNNSPLHSFFEWNNTKAAEAYRLQQARGLIRAVVAVYTSPDKPARRMKAYVHIPEPGAPHYRSVDHAMSQERTRDLVLRQAWREFQAWRRRYSELDEFAKLFETADHIAKKLSADS